MDVECSLVSSESEPCDVVRGTPWGGYPPPLKVVNRSLRGGNRHLYRRVPATPQGGDRDPLGWSAGPLGVVNGSHWGGQRDPLGWSTGPLGVVNGTSWGGQREPLGWSAGPFGVVGGTCWGGRRDPSGWSAAAFGVRRGGAEGRRPMPSPSGGGALRPGRRSSGANSMARG